jgi:hypothetical protein
MEDCAVKYSFMILSIPTVLSVISAIVFSSGMSVVSLFVPVIKLAA